MSESREELQAKVDALQARVTEFEQFFYERKDARAEGWEAGRAVYWPKAEAARADTLILKVALEKLIAAAKEVPPTAALGSRIVNAEFALTRADRSLDARSLVDASLKALLVLEGRFPPNTSTSDVIAELQEALRVS